MDNALSHISKAGVAVWLDDLSRERLENHSLEKLIKEDNVVGVTTNPSIFSAAIGKSELYKDDIIKHKDKTIEEIITILTTDDVRNACDLFSQTFAGTHGCDGRISIEVDPRFAKDTKASIAQGMQLWRLINRPNLLIKVPATTEGLPVIARYKQVLDAFAIGLENRISNGHSISDIHSVASFFISRIDSEVDKQLPSDSELKGSIAIANAIMAYDAFLNFEKSERWQKLSTKGGNIQRPLWASTGVKDPAYDPTRYVMLLVARDTVNTMPEATLDAVRKSGIFTGDTITPNILNAKSTLGKLALSGIDLDKITDLLESDGVSKFEAAWLDLMNSIKTVSGK